MSTLRPAIIGLLALAALAVSGLLSGPGALRPEPQSAEAALLSEVKKLTASDAQHSDEFGFSVAVSGDTAVVGARWEDAGGSNAGAAYVFQRDQGGGDNWGEVKKLTASDAQADDRFGNSVAVSGDTAVVGAHWEDAGGDYAGAAYVFQRDQGGAGNWGEAKKLTASDAQAVDSFGDSVALSGDTAVVGAEGEDAGGTNAGAAYVFQRDQGGAGNWGEVKKLTASDAQAVDLFGWSVALSGDTAVVGAYGWNLAGTNAAAAYVFRRDQGGAGNWGEVKKLTASDAQDYDRFGWSVALSGETAVVGAHGEDAGGSDAGAAYVFERDQGGEGNWGEVKKLTASDAQAGDEFGFSVAVSGANAVVGARDAGAAYVFQRHQGGADNWGEVEKLTAYDEFGFSVAVNGPTAVVGARGAGAAYVFQLPAPPGPHYECYQIADAPPPVPPVHLETQFGEEDVAVGPASLLCPPALKNGQGDLDQPHLKCYDIVGQDPQQVVRLEDQFGVEPSVVVGQATRLCVPALKEVALPIPEPPPPGPPPTTPHYECFEIDDPDPGVAVDIETQFGIEQDVAVGLASYLCAPALKNGEGDLDAPHLKCYDIAGQDPPHIVNLETQFGMEPLVEVLPAQMLCVPAEKTLLGPVGGLAAFPDVDAPAPGTVDSSGGSSFPYAVIAGAVAALALVAGGWYARRRRVR